MSFRHIKAEDRTVIAFDPFEGTGDRSSEPISVPYGLDFEAGEAIIPRSKAAVRSEARLTLATTSLYDRHPDPRVFAGNISLMGLNNDNVDVIGEIGHRLCKFTNSLFLFDEAEPTATLTTGADSSGERIAYPHAIYNGWEVVQVCGFLAVQAEAPEEYLDALSLLRPDRPVLFEHL